VLQVGVVLKFSLIIWTCLSASLNPYGPNTWLSPARLQNNGVQHHHPYKASKCVILILA
jgi:hypothetical protein